MALLLILVFGFFFIQKLIWIDQPKTIFGDGQDYYSYLIAFFIKHNVVVDASNGSQILQTSTGGINVHTIGVALLMAPFFLIGYLFAIIFNYPVDGMSEPFQKMATISSFFYCLVGLWFLKKLLQQLNVKPQHIFIVLLTVFFGTNLLNYALNESAMAHAYSFSLISLFLCLTNKLYKEKKFSLIPVAFVVYGLIVLVRPVNAMIILFIPAFSDQFSEFILNTKAILTQKRKLIIGAVLFLAIVSIQSIAWYYQNGQLLQNNYSGNNFYFLNPHPLLMLFSFNSGFFIYTPVCLIMLFGLAPLFFTNRFKFFVFAFFLVFSIYVFSSYWGYTYFDGLGIRTLVDFYPLFAILLAMLLEKFSTKRSLKLTLTPLMIVAVLLNLVYCFQYKNGIIKAAGMSYDKFAYVFLKTNKVYGDSIGGIHDLSPFDLNKQEKVTSYKNNLSNVPVQSDFGMEGYTFKKPYSKLHLKVKLERKELSPRASFNAMLVCSVTSPNNEVKCYQACRLNDVPGKKAGRWKKQIFEINVYGNFNINDKLSVHVVNPDKQTFFINNFNLEVYNISS